MAIKLPIKIINWYYFGILTLFLSSMGIYPATLLLNHHLSILLIIFFYLLMVYFISTFLLKKVVVLPNSIEVFYPTRFFKRTIIISYKDIIKIKCSSGNGSGDINRFLIKQNKGLPTFISCGLLTDHEIADLVQLFRDAGIEVKKSRERL